MIYFLIILFALLFGLLEGVTEWLPVSSTGHLILLEEILKAAGYDLSAELGFVHDETFFNFFLVAIQLGAVLAVVLLFFRRLWPFGRGVLNAEERAIVLSGGSESLAVQKAAKHRAWKRLAKILVGVLPAAAVGLLFELFHLEDKISNWAVVSSMLLLYGAFFIAWELFYKRRPREIRYRSVDDLPWRVCLYIGLAQVLALVPGTSRSAVTILAGLALGLPRDGAAEYSFFLSVPVMAGASLLKSVSFFLECGLLSLNEWLFLGVGFLAAFVFSLLVVRWLLAFVKRHTFIGFGAYRMALGLFLLILFPTLGVAL